jgi:hypothetical protein
VLPAPLVLVSCAPVAELPEDDFPASLRDEEESAPLLIWLEAPLPLWLSAAEVCECTGAVARKSPAVANPKRVLNLLRLNVRCDMEFSLHCGEMPLNHGKIKMSNH